MAEARPALSAHLLMDELYARLHSYGFTPREEQMVQLVLEGLSNKEIAQRCSISEQTVKDHLKHVYSKAGIHHRTALVSALLKFPPSGVPRKLSTARRLPARLR